MERELNHSAQIVQRENLVTEIGSKVYFGGLVDDVSAGGESRALRGRARERRSARRGGRSGAIACRKNRVGVE